MATNRELLKEAIADAKAVKEMAIANAKAALEETFTPQLKSMLSMKLQEMHDDEESENLSETETEEEMDEILDLDELLSELENEESEDIEDEIEDENEGEPLELEDMTDEDLKKFIEDVISDMVSSGELEAGEATEEEEEDLEDMDNMEDEEDFDLDELLAEVEGVEGDDEELMNEEEEDLDEIFGFGKKGSGGSKFVKDFIASNSEEIDSISSIDDKSAKNSAAKELIVKFYNSNVRKMDAGALRSDVSVLRTALGLEGLGGAEKSSVSTSEALESELQEAYSTIENLRQDLNEVNLLNAKLLYTNKIFKAKNLTEGQKINVLTSFDKATTVKEVKLVFETLNEGIKVKSSMIKENLGSASKSMGTTKTTQPIVESEDMVKRFQKLAGII